MPSEYARTATHSEDRRCRLVFTKGLRLPVPDQSRRMARTTHGKSQDYCSGTLHGAQGCIQTGAQECD
eukprot:4894076-Amphidinium_carterae.1